MSDEIKPALTAEEWASWHKVDAFERANFIAIREGLTRHSLAALCLYQQSYGFSREDVRLLGLYAAMFHGDHGEPARLQNLAARIEALLPPAETEER